MFRMMEIFSQIVDLFIIIHRNYIFVRMTHLQLSEFSAEVSAMSCWNKWFQFKWTTTTITISHCFGPFIYELSKVLWFTFNHWAMLSYSHFASISTNGEYSLNSQQFSNANQFSEVSCRRLLQNDDCHNERKRCYLKAAKGWWPLELLE